MGPAKKNRWSSGDAAENARRELPRLAAEYFGTVRQVLAGNPQPPELHPLRLASKRFRYTLEMFRPCYGTGLNTRLKALKELQDLLGDCNDAVAAQPLAAGILNGRPEEQRSMQEFLQKRAEDRAAEFRRHWTGTFDAPGREQWWTGYLVRAR